VLWCCTYTIDSLHSVPPALFSDPPSSTIPIPHNLPTPQHALAHLPRPAPPRRTATTPRLRTFTHARRATPAAACVSTWTAYTGVPRCYARHHAPVVPAGMLGHHGPDTGVFVDLSFRLNLLPISNASLHLSVKQEQARGQVRRQRGAHGVWDGRARGALTARTHHRPWLTRRLLCLPLPSAPAGTGVRQTHGPSFRPQPSLPRLPAAPIPLRILL